MTYDEIELEAKLLELTEQVDSFDELDDDVLLEIVEEVRTFTDGDFDEAYEYLIQYAPLDHRRFYALCVL